MSPQEAVVPAAHSGAAAFPCPQSWLLYEGEVPLALSKVAATGRGWWSVEASALEQIHVPAERLEPVGKSCVGPELADTFPTLVMTDADSTLLEGEVIDELAELAGVRDEVEAITAAAMRGEIDFSQSLRRRVNLLAGLPATAIEEVGANLSLMPGACDLITWAHGVGAKFGVVSGGFAEVLRPLADALGIDFLLANRLEVHGGVLTGRTVGPVVDARAKVDALNTWSGGQAGLVVAAGDGSNDIAMLRSAGVGVAFCAKPAVREATSSRLDLRRLDAVVGLLGHSLP